MDPKIRELLLAYKKSKGISSLTKEEEARYSLMTYEKLLFIVKNSLGTPESLVMIDTGKEHLVYKLEDEKEAASADLRNIGFQVDKEKHGSPFYYPL